MAELTVVSPTGSVTIARDVVEQIATATIERCYGVVGVAPASRLARLFRGQRLSVGGDASGMRVTVHVIVEYGLNLAEVSATLRSRVSYDLERIIGLPVAAVEVFVEDVRVTL